MSDEEEEPLDPRIQQELERLNKASLLINKLENDLDDARAHFRSLLTESTQQLGSLTNRLGSCIDKAKPYYDCRLKAKEVQIKAHQSATKYERAMSMQTAAREMVELAEQGYLSKKQQPSFDTAWQEMLNHATMKVMTAESERLISEGEHQRTAKLYSEVQEEVNTHYKEHKRSISKSKAYYDLKANFHKSLENQKVKIDQLQTDIDSSKKLYSKALSNLEGISEEIHQNRQQRKACKSLGTREAGVGSESPLPPPYDKVVDTKTNNNNTDLSQEAEIIISFPPVATKPKDNARHGQSKPDTYIRLSSDAAATAVDAVNDCCSDEPVDISGIKITVIPVTSDTAVNGEVSLTEADNSDNRRVEGEDNLDSVDNDDFVDNDTTTDGLSCPEITKCDSSVCSSTTTSPVAMRHKRILSGSIKLSAKQLLHESPSIDSDSGSVNSFVAMDDEGVKCAMSDEYFDGTYEAELRKSTHEDYSKLPENLSVYQKRYEYTRKSVSSFPFEDAGLKLDQVLKLLEDDESIV